MQYIRRRFKILYNLLPVEDICEGEEIRTNIRIVNNKLTTWISFLKGNKRKKTEVYPRIKNQMQRRVH